LIFVKFSDDSNDFILDSLSSKERYEFDVKRSIDMALLAKETADYESARFDFTWLKPT
jgi:hypothetical protein